MSEPYRALLMILALSLPLLAMGQRWLCPALCTVADFRRRAALWVVLLVSAYLSQNFWLFCVVATVVLVVVGGRDKRPLSLFVFLLFTIPNFSLDIPGFLDFRLLLSINYPRLLALVLLLPAWWWLRRQPGTRPFGSLPTDIFLLGYVALQLILQLQADSGTNTARYGLYAILDVLLPYYVASRSLRNEQDWRDTLASFVFAVALMAPIAIFEWLKHWLLYQSLPGHLGVEKWGMGGYLLRGDSLRAVATAGHSLVLGYAMVVGLALYPFVAALMPSRGKRWLLAALLLGLLAPVSRGPWVGGAAVLCVLVALNAHRWRRLGQLLGFGAPLTLVLLLTPMGDRMVDLLPFVGTVDSYNVDYRSRLMDAAWVVIKLYPFFGSSDYLSMPEMQTMVQGEGIIDLVNIYVSVALSSGLVGLSAFVLVFFTAAAAVGFRLLREQPATEGQVLGHVLMAALVGVLVMIGTLSSILNVPLLYWLLAGMLVAYRDFPQLSRRTHTARQVEEGPTGASRHQPAVVFSVASRLKRP
jgi:hypothetical protein